jgi:hypothetical protein
VTGRNVLVLGALVVTVVVAVGAVVAHRGNSAPLPPTPTAVPTPASFPSIAPAPPVKAVQRLSGDAAKFDSGTGAWSGAGATLSRVTAPVHSGSGALQLTVTNPLGGSMAAWSPREKATGGDRYVATAQVRAVTAIRGVQAELRFINASGQVTDTETGQLQNDSLSSWTQILAVVAIAPKGTTGVQLGLSFPVVGAGGQHVVDDASITQTPGGSTAVVPPLNVIGTQIVQGNGKPLIMRGLQRFGLEGGTNNPLPTNSEIGQIKLWGANEVRISLGEQKWLATSCHFVRDYPQEVDRVVQWVTSRGMVALLNLHFSSLGTCGAPGLTPMADSPGAVTFWQEVANRYKGNPLVAFDLFNEPNVPQSTWLDGGTFVDKGLIVQAAGMQQLYNTVRGTGATNLVVVSGLDYADHAPTETVQGVNVAYGAHAYQCTTGPPPGCTAARPYDASVPLSHWVDFAKSHAVIVTEFGWPGFNGAYNASVIAFARAHGWGWSGFAWDGSTGGLFDLVQAHPASDGTTIEPNTSGMSLVAGFARNSVVEPAH